MADATPLRNSVHHGKITAGAMSCHRLCQEPRGPIMEYVWMPCTIENTGFNSERRFEVDLPEDGGKIVGTAYVEYLQDSSGNVLTDQVPPYGQTSDGFVKCRIVKRQGDSALIEFPGTEVFHVPQEALNERRRR